MEQTTVDAAGTVAPPVKLNCRPTASNARSAFNGNQRRFMELLFEMILPFASQLCARSPKNYYLTWRYAKSRFFYGVIVRH